MQHETDLSGRPEGLSLRSLASLSPALSLSLLPSLPLSLSSLCASPFCVCLSSRAAASPDADFCAALLAAAASLAADSFFARSRFSRSCSGGTVPQTSVPQTSVGFAALICRPSAYMPQSHSTGECCVVHASTVRCKAMIFWQNPTQL